MCNCYRGGAGTGKGEVKGRGIEVCCLIDLPGGITVLVLDAPWELNVLEFEME